jgi:hypothetical protein
MDICPNSGKYIFILLLHRISLSTPEYFNIRNKYLWLCKSTHFICNL